MNRPPFVPTHKLRHDIPQLKLAAGTLLRQGNPFGDGRSSPWLFMYTEEDWRKRRSHLLREMMMYYEPEGTNIMPMLAEHLREVGLDAFVTSSGRVIDFSGTSLYVHVDGTMVTVRSLYAKSFNVFDAADPASFDQIALACRTALQRELSAVPSIKD